VVETSKDGIAREMEVVFFQLVKIFSANHERAMLDAGHYLIDTFYGGSIDQARSDRKRLSMQPLSNYITQLDGGDRDSPKKTWIYNSVNLAVQEHDFGDLFRTYGNLFLSHKVYLLSVHDSEIKRALIEKAAERNYTVAQLRDEIADINRAKKPKQIQEFTFLRLINAPERLFHPNHAPHFEINALSQVSPGKLSKIQSRAEVKISAIEGEIDEIGRELELRRNHVEKYRSLLQSIDQVRSLKKKKNVAKPGGKAGKAETLMGELDGHTEKLVISFFRTTD